MSPLPLRARAALAAALRAALKAALRAALFAAAIFALAGAPLAVATEGGRLRFAPERLVVAAAEWVHGLADGSTFEYRLGATRWDFAEYAPAFLAVSAANLAIPGAVGIALGSLAGVVLRSRRRGWLDRAADAIAATPDFILALAAQVFVIAVLKPLGLRVPIGPSPAGLSAVALAVICVYPLCFSFRVAARASRRIADADFVVYARAKGLSDDQVLRRHVGAAVVPEIVRELPTILSFMQGTLFIVEYLFALPGIARFLFTTAFSGRKPGFYQVYQYNLGVFVLAGIGLAYVLVYAALRLSLSLARKVLVNE